MTDMPQNANVPSPEEVERILSETQINDYEVGVNYVRTFNPDKLNDNEYQVRLNETNEYFRILHAFRSAVERREDFSETTYIIQPLSRMSPDTFLGADLDEVDKISLRNELQQFRYLGDDVAKGFYTNLQSKLEEMSDQVVIIYDAWKVGVINKVKSSDKDSH